VALKVSVDGNTLSTGDESAGAPGFDGVDVSDVDAPDPGDPGIDEVVAVGYPTPTGGEAGGAAGTVTGGG